MSCGFIGRPYKVVYCAKNFKTGITGITAKVLKPDGSVHSNYTLSEFSESGFEGMYFFNFLSNSVDPYGEYTVAIDSPNEGNHKAKFKIEMRSLDDFGGGSGAPDLGDIELELEVTRRAAKIEASKPSACLGISTKNISLSAKKPSVELCVEKPLASLSVEYRKADLAIIC